MVYNKEQMKTDASLTEDQLTNFRKPKRRVDLKYLGVLKSREEYRREIIEWSFNVSVFRNDLIKISRRLNDPNFLSKLIESGKSFSDAMAEDEHYVEKSRAYPELKLIVDAISNGLDHTSQNATFGNPAIGVQSKARADQFADDMGVALSKVRDEGYTSVRAIAERFNELGIKSARGFDWTHTTVYQLIQRRKSLGLEGDSLVAG